MRRIQRQQIHCELLWIHLLLQNVISTSGPTIMWDESFQMYWWTIYTRINQGLLLKIQVNWFSPGTHWIRIFAKWTQEFGCPNAFQNIKIFHWDIAFIKQDAHLLSIYFDKFWIKYTLMYMYQSRMYNITSILQSFLALCSQSSTTPGKLWSDSQSPSANFDCSKTLYKWDLTGCTFLHWLFLTTSNLWELSCCRHLQLVHYFVAEQY